MTPSAATTPSLLLGLFLAAFRPATPCLAWVRFSSSTSSSFSSIPSALRRGAGVSPFAPLHAQQQPLQRRWRSAAASSSSGEQAAAAKAPTRRRRASGTAAEKAPAAASAETTSTKGKKAKAAGTTAAKPTKATKAAAAAAPKTKKPAFQPHPRWQEQLEGIRRMRAEGPEAPVDFAGCAELGLRNATSERHMRFQTLISSMMSSQTTDLVNEGAMRRLHEACGITIEGLEALGEEGIIRAIQPVSFYTAKAQNILKVCKILKEKYDGDIPRTFEELLELPGIGPKMGTLIMAYGWGEVVGICVDTHVHRISNRLGWADTWNYKNPKAQNPEKTRKLLESWMPREHWEEVNPLLVGLGQNTCRAISPKCHECKITHLCPSYIPPEACL